jgi:hypothetical protein
MECDNCEKEAKHNVQKTWVHYPVKGEGDYGDPTILTDTEIADHENLHLCDACYKKEFGG